MNSDIARTTFRSEGSYGCVPGQGLGPQHSEEDLIERGRQQNTKLVVVGQNLRALKHAGKSGFFSAEKSVGSHVKKSTNSSFFNRITFHFAVRCRTFRKINLQNFKLKFQTVAEKTVKYFRGYFILLHPVQLQR